jgi:site-specific recombinases, DNA invertase pin homologs
LERPGWVFFFRKKEKMPMKNDSNPIIRSEEVTIDKVSRLYDELISYADLYDSANFEAKKMIVSQLIRRVDVYRGYQINISFNFDLTPYIEGE